MDEKLIRAAAAAVVAELWQSDGSSGLSEAKPSAAGVLLPLEASARHVHLTPEAVARLFGPETQLQSVRALSQPGEFLAEQRITLATAHGTIERVAVLGPVRAAVQAELSLTDCRTLGLDAPVRLSGDLRGAGDVCLLGPAGVLEARGSVIAAQNHIHLPPAEAIRLGVREGQRVRVRAETARPITFEQVTVRTSERFAPAVHLDLDEANACGWRPGDMGRVLCGAAAENRSGTGRDPGCPAPEACPPDKLITEARAKELAEPGRRLTLRRGTIVTPAAWDVFAARRIALEWIEGGSAG
ncbi:MAG: phosphate propanoyltransferase [Oscillospiraceae bacterium]|nr:phosphate propanoyltransferase [Oscillospiraceae bacterium]